MLLTLTFNYSSDYIYDVQINQQQSIRETLQVLQQKGMLPGLDLAACVLKSVRTRQFVNQEMTYEENNIHTGDVIIITKLK